MFTIPDCDRRGVPFNPALVDDLRSALLMGAWGRRKRAQWMMLRLVCRYHPDEVGRVLRAACTDTRPGT